MSREYARALSQEGSIRGGGASTDDPFRSGALDFNWLRVPDETRATVREHLAELQKTAAAALADQLFVNVEFRK